MPWPVFVHTAGGGRWTVDTLLQLDALLTALATVGPPGWVEITSSRGRRGLGVAVGRGDVSSLTYADRDQPGWLTSVGASPGALGGYEFTALDGSAQLVGAEQAVPVQRAWQATTEFVQTGQRPTCVQWRSIPSHGSGSVPAYNGL
ncbi:MAG: Imm1 family immunity protein [Nocardioidaceae bacterium]